ncbi:MAG: MATE family efflux transporter [Pseudomonadota bacterium]
MFSMKSLRELFVLALPMVVSQGALAAMVFIDRYFMSRIDAVHIAAALGGGVSYFVVVALFTGLVAYGNAMVAQHYGAGELRQCAKVTTQGFLLALASQPFLLPAALLMSGLFALMGHAPEQVELERQYFFVLVSGALFNLLKVALASHFAGIGKTRVVMIADLAAVLLNVPLTYALVFGEFGAPALGIRGAALGTVISMAFAVVVLLLCYFNPVHRARFYVMASFRLDAQILRRFFRLGLPSGLETFIGAATFNFFLLLYQSYGVAEGAAMAIVFNWDMLSFVPMVGLNIAIMSLIGRAVGSGDLGEAKRIISSAFILGMSYSGVFGLIFIAFRYPLVGVFEPPEGDFAEILSLGAQMMIGLASYVMADAAILIASGVLRGAGDTRWLMRASISVHILMLLVQVLIIEVLLWPPLVSWWCFVLTLLSLALLYNWRVFSGGWRNKERLAAVMGR